MLKGSRLVLLVGDYSSKIFVLFSDRQQSLTSRGGDPDLPAFRSFDQEFLPLVRTLGSRYSGQDDRLPSTKGKPTAFKMINQDSPSFEGIRDISNLAQRYLSEEVIRINGKNVTPGQSRLMRKPLYYVASGARKQNWRKEATLPNTTLHGHLSMLGAMFYMISRVTMPNIH